MTAAHRIVPEWKEYDLEIKNLINRVDNEQEVHEEHTDTEVVEEAAETKSVEEKEEEGEEDKASDENKHSEL